jgi:hypothetical protein
MQPILLNIINIYFLFFRNITRGKNFSVIYNYDQTLNLFKVILQIRVRARKVMKKKVQHKKVKDEVFEKAIFK